MTHWKTLLEIARPRSINRLFDRFAPRLFRLRQIDAERWRATALDPYFIFPALPRAARTQTYFLDARPGVVRDRVYLDWGDGFPEAESIDLGYAQCALIRLDLTDSRGVKRIRLDPSDGPADFAFHHALDDAPWIARAESQIDEARARRASLGHRHPSEGLRAAGRGAQDRLETPTRQPARAFPAHRGARAQGIRRAIATRAERPSAHLLRGSGLQYARALSR